MKLALGWSLHNLRLGHPLLRSSQDVSATQGPLHLGLQNKLSFVSGNVRGKIQSLVGICERVEIKPYD